jgi:hypothetical protein
MAPKLQIRMKTFDELESGLRRFQQIYVAEPARRRELRDLVIKAKDRARFASRNPKATADKRARKAEMVQWMLVWLDDPSMFGDWAALRRIQMEASSPPAQL